MLRGRHFDVLKQNISEVDALALPIKNSTGEGSEFRWLVIIEDQRMTAAEMLVWENNFFKFDAGDRSVNLNQNGVKRAGAFLVSIDSQKIEVIPEEGKIKCPVKVGNDTFFIEAEGGCGSDDSYTKGDLCEKVLSATTGYLLEHFYCRG